MCLKTLLVQLPLSLLLGNQNVPIHTLYLSFQLVSIYVESDVKQLSQTFAMLSVCTPKYHQ